MEVFDGFRAAYLADRAQFFLDVVSGPFFGIECRQTRIWGPGAALSRMWPPSKRESK